MSDLEDESDMEDLEDGFQWEGEEEQEEEEDEEEVVSATYDVGKGTIMLMM